uniref:Uncharacterized protein n=1 Tax=Cacopsylla melanoneura TaxID=428564 RepID=A0A8D8RS25_9HEMI
MLFSSFLGSVLGFSRFSPHIITSELGMGIVLCMICECDFFFFFYPIFSFSLFVVFVCKNLKGVLFCSVLIRNVFYYCFRYTRFVLCVCVCVCVCVYVCVCVCFL